MFKVGDVVYVNGRMDYELFNNQKGVIVVSYQEKYGYPHPYGELWGIDFKEIRNGSFHTLNGELSDATGYWVREELITFLRERQKTGFGKFIQRIEG